MRAYSSLTHDLVHRFGNRKINGRLSVIVNAENNSVYMVPRNIEHIEFVSRLLGLDDYSEAKDKAKLLIPSHITILPNLETFNLEVQGFLTGVSGLEIGFKVRHPREALEIVHRVTKEFARIGDYPISQRLKDDKIEYKYSEKSTVVSI